MRDQAGWTALHYAAVSGNVEAAKLLVEKNPALNYSPTGEEVLPIHIAAYYGSKDVVSYLFTRHNIETNPFSDKSGLKLLNLVIVAEFYGKWRFSFSFQLLSKCFLSYMPKRKNNYSHTLSSYK